MILTLARRVRGNKKRDGDPVVYQLIYTSSATPDLDDFALREIAQSSSFYNQQMGITGLLLFHDGSILQVLEGDEMSVCALYGIVQRCVGIDANHRAEHFIARNGGVSGRVEQHSRRIGCVGQFLTAR